VGHLAMDNSLKKPCRWLHLCRL